MTKARIITLTLLLNVVCAFEATAGQGEPLRITHGVAAGDVTATSAVIWSRASGRSRMVVDYAAVTEPRWPLLRMDGPQVDAGSDFTGKVVLEGLAPDTRYLYWVRFVGGDREAVSETGQFRTAPVADTTRPVSIVWWGDVGGQGYCREPDRGYALFNQMARLAPDLAIANGDSVYVDHPCPPVPGLSDQRRNAVSPDPETAASQILSAADERLKSPGAILAAFRSKWKYNLEDESYRRFRAQTAHLYQWDDHEVIDDWSPGEKSIGALRGKADTRPMSVLMAPGRQSFFEFTPIRPGGEGRIYRRVRFGKLLELFVLDDRSYRDEDLVPDGAGKVLDVRLENGERRKLEGRKKTLLGSEQREWLLQGLREAEAQGVTWKLISTDVPLSAASGSYRVFAPEGPMTPLYEVRDGWGAGIRLQADKDGNQENPFGFESELREILAAIKAAGIRNVLFVATDVHHARLLRYEPRGDLAGLVFHEFIAGPANASSSVPRLLSRAFNPIELFARGRGPDPMKPSFLNFGYIRVDADGLLTVEIRDAEGVIPLDDRGRVGALTLVPARQGDSKEVTR